MLHTTAQQNLLQLLKAPSKQAVDDFLCACARAAPSGGIDPSHVAQICETFGLTSDDAQGLRRAGIALVNEAVSSVAATVEQVGTLLASDFHESLRALLARVVVYRLDEWRAESLAAGGVSAMPRLESASWQVYRRPAASPAMLLRLSLGSHGSGDTAAAGGVGVAASGGGRTVNVEVSKEQLDVLVQSLAKVKEQLDHV